MTKLKIDLHTGVLEVEGDEQLVREIYAEFKQALGEKAGGKHLSELDAAKRLSSPRTGTRATSSARGGKKKAASRKESHGIVKDLDLSSKGNQIPLKEFFSQKAPSTALEKNAVFVYYLQKLARVSGITPEHVYTCYKHVNEKVPGALRQSLIDTAHHKGWIDTSKLENISIPTVGENFVEHDLPKKERNATK